MFDTLITIIGNVATKPNRRALSAGALTDFRMASTSRRYDKATESWVDGDELFLKVSCWRALADNVADSIRVGDPVIVRGRLYSRRITEGTAAGRYVYEVSAQSVGHDLARGVGDFQRRGANPGKAEQPELEFDAIVRGIASDATPITAGAVSSPA
ncbi:single-strand DNA-binding protein [Stackebrandtia endophytica]|uniref:Single-strand DNA-binding protein n=1 Tax=Stackebrandtia endophytica TaxID=1496996 RepID=A0A543B1Q2_9ACTN|nr:single-stranded DNA-binding protein [Stackebrandtia endophytica]TQL78762.1 single-strand DNA-binding protein [Stackebrandtia endophytica]